MLRVKGTWKVRVGLICVYVCALAHIKVELDAIYLFIGPLV